jgi:hypothetical protein
VASPGTTFLNTSRSVETRSGLAPSETCVTSRC